MPLQRPLRHTLKGLWELRPRQWRIIYYCRDNVIFIIGFMYKKKSNEMPGNIVRRAIKFLKEVSK
jgi:mRNA-degrading endonuclease RelE of RelBE toxin-antitoxin system